MEELTMRHDTSTGARSDVVGALFSLKYEVNHLMSKYGLTREEGEVVIHRHKGDREAINAMAKEIKKTRLAPG
jgi:hypothetical protein